MKQSFYFLISSKDELWNVFELIGIQTNSFIISTKLIHTYTKCFIVFLFIKDTLITSMTKQMVSMTALSVE